MYVAGPARFETFGAVKVYEVSRVQALMATGAGRRARAICVDDFEKLVRTAEKTVIAVPVKDEDPDLLDGVLRAIPVYSPIVLVSASSRSPLNIYGAEVEVAEMVHKDTGRTIVVVHQRDPLVAELLRDALPHAIDEEGLVRFGKGEGLLVAVLLAEGLGAGSIGFVDADNYVPGSVTEYALTYYTVLSAKGSRYKMVRVAWGYKAHGEEEVYLRRVGRVSTVVNRLINRALSRRRRKETEIVKTSNSGEHAMTMELARTLTYAGGFAVETQELVGLLDACYVGLGEGVCSVLPEGAEVYQVETLNPHIHEEKGESHVTRMLVESLAALYHSRLADERLGREILGVLRDVGYESEPDPPLTYRYPEGLNAKSLLDRLLAESPFAFSFGL